MDVASINRGPRPDRVSKFSNRRKTARPVPLTEGIFTALCYGNGALYAQIGRYPNSTRHVISTYEAGGIAPPGRAERPSQARLSGTVALRGFTFEEFEFLFG